MQVCAWTWNLLVVVGLLVLRVREPTLKRWIFLLLSDAPAKSRADSTPPLCRPYRTYLATPILFASTALFLIVLSCFSKPWQSLAAFVFCSAGTVPYYLQVRRSGMPIFASQGTRTAADPTGLFSPLAEKQATEGLEMT